VRVLGDRKFSLGMIQELTEEQKRGLASITAANLDAHGESAETVSGAKENASGKTPGAYAASNSSSAKSKSNDSSGFESGNQYLSLPPVEPLAVADNSAPEYSVPTQSSDGAPSVRSSGLRRSNSMQIANEPSAAAAGNSPSDTSGASDKAPESGYRGTGGGNYAAAGTSAASVQPENYHYTPESINPNPNFMGVFATDSASVSDSFAAQPENNADVFKDKNNLPGEGWTVSELMDKQGKGTGVWVRAWTGSVDEKTQGMNKYVQFYATDAAKKAMFPGLMSNKTYSFARSVGTFKDLNSELLSLLMQKFPDDGGGDFQRLKAVASESDDANKDIQANLGAYYGGRDAWKKKLLQEQSTASN